MLSNTMLGGVSCMPNPCRNMDSTMMVRVKEVMATTTAGNTARTVNNRMIFSASATGTPPALPVSKPMPSGAETAAACAVAVARVARIMGGAGIRCSRPRATR